MERSWPSRSGARRLPPTSLLKPMPRMTAWIRWPVALRVSQALEQEEPGAFADEEAVSTSVEGSTPAAGRKSAQLAEAHLGVEGRWPRQATGQHGVRPARHQLGTRELQGVERRGTRRVQCVAAAAQVQGVGDQTSWVPRDVSVERLRGFGLRANLSKALREAPSKGRQRHGRGGVRRQYDIAEDNAGAVSPDGLGAGVLNGHLRGAQGDPEHGIQPVKEVGVDGEVLSLELEVFKQTCSPGVDPVRGSDLRRIRLVRVEVPTPDWNLGGGICSTFDGSPELPQAPGAGEDPPKPTMAMARRSLTHGSRSGADFQWKSIATERRHQARVDGVLTAFEARN